MIFYSLITFSYTKYFVHSYTIDVVFTLSYWPYLLEYWGWFLISSFWPIIFSYFELEIVNRWSTRITPPQPQMQTILWFPHCDSIGRFPQAYTKIGKESIQNCMSCTAYTRRCAIFQQFYCKVLVEWPWRYRSRSKVVARDTPCSCLWSFVPNMEIIHPVLYVQ